MLFKMFTSCKIWKKPTFLCFFTTLDLIWPKFCLQDHTFIFFADFWWMKFLMDSININLSCTFEKKKLIKPQIKKFCILWVQSPHQKRGHNFFWQKTKAYHQLLQTFYFIKIYVLAELVMNLFLYWVIFSVKIHS